MKHSTVSPARSFGIEQGRRIGALVAGAVRWREATLVAAFIVLAVWFHVATDGAFFTPRNLSLLLRQATITAIVAAGVLVLIVMSEIDLSIGSAVYLVSVVVATLQVDRGWPTLAVVAAAILVGVILGAWNGFWVTRLAVPSFIVTLGGLLAFRGLGYWLTDANTIAPMQPSFVKLSEGFLPIRISYILIGISLAIVAGLLVRRYLRTRHRSPEGAATALVVTLGLSAAGLGLFAWIVGGFRGIPMAVLFLIAVTGTLALVMRRSTFGRNAYVIGSNRRAALLAGIDIRRHLFGGFVLMGALYGIAGVLITARLSASTPSTGNILELDAIAAAVIGGTSLRGGVGVLSGAVGGAILLATIDNGMSLLNVSSFVQQMLKGGILLVALALDSATRSET